MATLVKTTLFQNGGDDVPVVIATPTAQLSTNTETLLAGSETNIAGFPDVQARLSCVTNAVTVNLYLSTNAAFSDEFLYRAFALTAGTPVNFFGAESGTGYSPICFPFLRFKIDSTVDGAHGTVTVLMCAGR